MKKLSLRTIIVSGLAVLWTSACFAAGGRVSYPDGQPVVGARVQVHLQEVAKYQLSTDAGGRFTLPTMDFLDAFVQIQAPDGQDYATVNLPVRLFESGEAAAEEVV